MIQAVLVVVAALFPTVQTCEAGEIGWIDPAEESEVAASRVVLTANASPILPATDAPTSTTLVEAHEDDEDVASTTSVQLADDADDSDDDGGETLWPTLLVGLAIGIGVGIYQRYRALHRAEG